MATGGVDEVSLPGRRRIHRQTIFRRGSSVACDTNISEHRGSVSDHVDYSRNSFNAEIEREGEVLFETFMAEQIQKEGMTVADVQDERLNQGPRELQQHNWMAVGAEFRTLADKFAHTQERENIRRRAGNIDATQIEYSQFLAMLNELFHQGYITRERIIVLFYFCSDLAISVLRQKAVDVFKRLMDWTLFFIRDHVCSWVAEHGGWGAVLSSWFQMISKIVQFGTIVVIGLAVCKWLRK